eukprot:c2631_g1_i2 orf=1-177(-)
MNEIAKQACNCKLNVEQQAWFPTYIFTQTNCMIFQSLERERGSHRETARYFKLGDRERF